MGTPSKIAILIDFENLETGVRKQFDTKASIEPIIGKMNEIGVTVLRRAYGDWVQHSSYRHGLMQCGVELIERPNVSPGRNGADIKLAIDAVEAALRNPDWDHFVVVTGNSDFLPLVHKLRELNRAVTIVGVDACTSNLLKKNCDQYYAYEDLATLRQPTKKLAADALRLLEKAIVTCADRHKQMRVADLRQQVQQLDSAFSEVACGFESFRDLLDFIAANSLMPIELAFQNGSWHVNITGKITLKTPPAAQAKSGGGGRRDQKRPAKSARKDKPEKKEPEQEWDERPLKPEEWEVLIEAVEKCVNEGAGRPNQGKLWIINAYLHRQRLDGKLPLANQILYNALQALVAEGVLSHPSQDTYLLPDDFEEKKKAFLDNPEKLAAAPKPAGPAPTRDKKDSKPQKASKPAAKDKNDDNGDDDDDLPVPRKDLPESILGQEDLYTPEELEEILEAEREYAAKAREEANREKKAKSKPKKKGRAKTKRTTRKKS